MEELARQVVAGAVWLVEDPSGTVVATATDGASVRGSLEPALDEVQRRCGATGLAEPAVLRPSEGGPQRLLVVTVPGLPGALAILVEGFDSAVGGAIEHLVNQVAHDIRNYAFTIGLQAELGERRSAHAPEIKGHFEAVLRQLASFKRYVERLLLFGRPTRLTCAEIDVERFLREELSRFRFNREAASLPISIGFAVDNDPGTAHWDRAAISTALEVLLDNAARSAEPPPDVTLGVRSSADSLELNVHDEGAGIPPDLLARLAVPMAVRRAGGAGLGLAIARKIVAAHGGRLTIASTSAGTTATVTLPREAPPD